MNKSENYPSEKEVTSSSVQSTKSGKSSQSSLSLAFAVVLAIPGFEMTKKLPNSLQINFITGI